MKLLYLFIFLSVWPNSFLLAEEIVPTEEIIVTARPLGFGDLKHIAQPISVLSEEHLDKVRTASIGETLANELGVSASQFGPYASRPIIRGLSGPRVLVLQNGIGTHDVSTVSVDHASTVEPFQTKQIEIFKGPATLLYGSGASGGLVNLVTGRIPKSIPDEIFSIAAETRINSINQENLFSFRTDTGIDNVALHMDGTRRNANNYDSADGEILNSAYDNTDFNIGTSYINDRGVAGFSFGRWNSTHHVPLDPDNPEAVFLETEQNRFDYVAQLFAPFAGVTSLKIRGAHNDYLHTEFEGSGMPGTIFFNDEWENRIELVHVPIANWKGALGAQVNIRSLSAVGEEAFIPAVKSQNIALFILEDTDINNWHFEIGGRFEHKHYEPTVTSDIPDLDFDVYSIAAGSHWHFKERHSLGLAIGRSQRAPSEEELFANGPHLATGTFKVGDPGLDEETANNIDISLSKETGELTWTVNLFYNYIEDFIYLEGVDSNGDGQVDLVDEDGIVPGELLSTRILQDNAIFYGIEAETRFKLIQSAWGDLQLRIFGDYVRGKIDGGNDLERINPARLGTGLDYVFNRVQANIDLSNVFRQTDTGPLETKTGGYTMLNAQLTYKFQEKVKTGLEVFIKGANLLDTDARRHTSFLKDRAPLAGRSGTIGIRARF